MCNILGANKSIDNHRIKLLSTWDLMKQLRKQYNLIYMFRMQSDEFYKYLFPFRIFTIMQPSKNKKF